MPELQLISIGGQSQVGKSTISKAMVGTLRQQGYDVSFELAGDFFRRTTVGVLEETGSELPDPETDDMILDRLVHRVLQNGVPFEQREWGDLHAKPVDNLVSRVGKRAIMQESASQWFSTVTQLALDHKRDVLVIDARHPRDRVMDFIASGKVVSAVDLMIDCSVEVAAQRRAVRGKPADYVASAEELLQEQQEVQKRRDFDANRAEFPFIMPLREDMIDFSKAIVSPEQAVRDCHFQLEDNHNALLPHTLYFDTTHVSLDAMRETISRLGLAAVRYTTAHAKLKAT